MSISRIGTGVATTTTVTVPAHAIGDLILIFAYRDGSTTPPTLPAGYTQVGLTKAGTASSAIVGYKIATSTSDTSGTWTNATELVCVVYRGAGGALIGDSQSNSGTTTTVNYPALTLRGTPNSLVVGFIGVRPNTVSLTTPPTGMTNIAVTAAGAAGIAAINDTNGAVLSWPSTNQTITSVTNSVTFAIEIQESTALREPIFNKPKSIAKAAVGVLGSALALLSTPPAPAPFAQYDWSHPQQPEPAPPQRQPYNPNIFTNPIPFAQYDWSHPQQPEPAPPQAVPYNPNIFTNPIPFAQYDWPRIVPLRLSKQFDPQPNYDDFYPNPIPFAQYDWLHPFDVASLPPQRQPYNSLIYSEVPFAQLDWTHLFDVASLPPQRQPYNISIYSGVPFYQTDWLHPQKPSVPPQQALPYNSLVYSGVPFYQTDWLHPQKPSVPPQQALPYNQLVYSEVPFLPVDLSKSIRTISSVSSQFPFNLNLNVVVTQTPFSQQIWVAATKPIISVPVVSGINTNLFTNPIPFAQYDWSKSVRLPTIPIGAFPANLGLTAVVVQSPFYQSSWPTPVKPKPRAVDIAGININLFTNPIPFAQYDWLKSQRIPSVPSSPIPASLSLSAVPFFQTDWSKPFRPMLRRVDVAGSNINIYSEVPFRPIDYSISRRIKTVSFNIASTNLSLIFVVPFSQLDWTRSRRISSNVSPVFSSLALLHPFVSTTPFAQLDWSKPFRTRVSRQFFNPSYIGLIEPVIPIIKTDVSGCMDEASISGSMQKASISGSFQSSSASGSSSSVKVSGVWGSTYKIVGRAAPRDKPT